MAKYLIVANPISGMGLARKRAPRLLDALHREGYDAELIFTSGAGDARTIASNAVPSEVSCIVAVGGDGTLNEIVNGVGDKRIPISLFPAGTGNVLAKEYHFPFRIKNACRMLATRRIVDMDVAVVNGRRFILFAGAGFDAIVARELCLNRRGRITMLSYIFPTIRTFFKYPFTPLSVTVDGQSAGVATSVLIANVHTYGGPFGFVRNADPADGMLDVCLMRGTRRIDLIRYVLSGIIRRNLDFADTQVVRGRNVTISASGDVPVQADGDYIGELPVNVELLPGRLPVIVP